VSIGVSTAGGLMLGARSWARLTAIYVVMVGVCFGFAAEPDESPHPELVLVLSGGGARGAAHIGVLKELEKLKIVPDMVVGTSMGSIVGGLYCAGWTPDQIEDLLAATNWDRVFTDSVPRSEVSFRRKQDDRPVLIPARLHFKGLKPYAPPGLIDGQNLELLLRTLETVSNTETDFDKLVIPFRAVATDISTGNVVVLDSGSLATALRASMSIPGVFPPVELDEFSLVDGGAVANLPIGVALDLGAENVVAVDITSPLISEGRYTGSFVDVISQVNNLLTTGNRSRDVERLRPNDIYIRPKLGDLSFIAFDRALEAVEIGARATRSRRNELSRFAATDVRWSEFVHRRQVRPDELIKITSIQIINSGWVEDEVVLKALALKTPTTIHRERLRERLLDLYNRRYFGLIHFTCAPEEDGCRLVISAPKPPFGRATLQFGLQLFDDFHGGSGHAFTARHQVIGVNRRGGEWENRLQLGSNVLFSSEYFQPWDTRLRWFAAPKIELSRRQQGLWLDGSAVAEYRMYNRTARLDIGRALGRWGEIRVGAFTAFEKAERRIGDPVFPDVERYNGGFELGLRVDRVDSVAFPRSGLELDARYRKSSTTLGADQPFEQLVAGLAFALSAGPVTVNPYFEYQANLEPSRSIFDVFSLGGVGRLTAFGADELIGEKTALARLMVHSRLFQVEMAGINVRVVGGIMAEVGDAFDRFDPISTDSLHTSWSIFLGADTAVGPAYLGYSRGDEGRDRVYFIIGDRF
jgi:NTE family protein